LFKYLLLDPSAKRFQFVQGPNCPGARRFQRCTRPLLLTSRAYGSPIRRNTDTTML